MESWQIDLEAREKEETRWEQADEEFSDLDEELATIKAGLDKGTLTYAEVESRLSELDEDINHFESGDHHNEERCAAIKILRERLETEV